MFIKEVEEVEGRVDRKEIRHNLRNSLKFLRAYFEEYTKKEIYNINDSDRNIFGRVMKRMGFISEKQNISDLKEFFRNNNFSEFIYLTSKYGDKICTESDPDCNKCILNKFCKKYREQQIISYKSDKNSPTVVDLFCGAGGLSLGFVQEKFKILLANDNNKVCTDTYKFNHPDVPPNLIINEDIEEIVSNIDSYIEGDKVDVVVGGPPCQGFSNANRQRLIDDPR
ncbi:MAG: DNA cytosine methyltransferase, partial [Candidatus Woesearchaeota archaeon]